MKFSIFAAKEISVNVHGYVFVMRVCTSFCQTSFCLVEETQIHFQCLVVLVWQTQIHFQCLVVLVWQTQIYFQCLVVLVWQTQYLKHVKEQCLVVLV